MTKKSDTITIRNNHTFHGELEQAVNNWLIYKQEKNQQYKPSGLNSLLSQVQKHANAYGEAAVVHAISESISGVNSVTFSCLHTNSKNRIMF